MISMVFACPPRLSWSARVSLLSLQHHLTHCTGMCKSPEWVMPSKKSAEFKASVSASLHPT